MNFGNTNWNLYRSFIAVFETGNLHRAADALGISYSAVWQNIRTLGDQLGFALFTPHTKGVIPTGDAKGLYPTVKSAVDLLVGAEVGSRAFTGESTGTIRMSMSGFIVELYVKRYLQDFCAKYPKVRLDFVGRAATDLLATGKIDFVIDLDYMFRGTDFKTIDLFSPAAVFVASKTFLAKHGLSHKISADQFQKLPLIAQGESYGAFGNTSDLFINVPSGEVLFSLLKSSIGIGFSAKEQLSLWNDPDLVELDVQGFTAPPTKIVCAYKTLSRPARAFIEGLVAWVKARG